MQPTFPTRRHEFSFILRAAILLAVVAVFGACDRHSAEEAPENYGHGSSHERISPDHQIDSTSGTHSFSDTVGTKEEQAETDRRGPAATPSPAPAGHF